jgi:preprotein translocase subunit YajC
MILAQTSSGGSSPLLLLMLAMPVVLWLMMRSQKKKVAAQQAQQRSAGIGDDIMTTAGIFGTIVDEDEDEGTVIVEIAPGTHIKMIRAGIARRIEEDDEYDDVDEDDDEEPDEAPTAEVDDNAEGPFRS